LTLFVGEAGKGQHDDGWDGAASGARRARPPHCSPTTAESHAGARAKRRHPLPGLTFFSLEKARGTFLPSKTASGEEGRGPARRSLAFHGHGPAGDGGAVTLAWRHPPPSGAGAAIPCVHPDRR